MGSRIHSRPSAASRAATKARAAPQIWPGLYGHCFLQSRTARRQRRYPHAAIALMTRRIHGEKALVGATPQHIQREFRPCLAPPPRVTLDMAALVRLSNQALVQSADAAIFTVLIQHVRCRNESQPLLLSRVRLDHFQSLVAHCKSLMDSPRSFSADGGQCKARSSAKLRASVFEPLLTLSARA